MAFRESQVLCKHGSALRVAGPDVINEGSVTARRPLSPSPNNEAGNEPQLSQQEEDTGKPETLRSDTERGRSLAGSAEASCCERVSRLGPTGTLQERSDPTQLTSLYNRTETTLPVTRELGPRRQASRQPARPTFSKQPREALSGGPGDPRLAS